MNAPGSCERAEKVLLAWETRLSAAEELCGTSGITTADVDGIRYAVTVITRIRCGSSVEIESADLTAMEKTAKELGDKSAECAVKWTRAALRDMR